MSISHNQLQQHDADDKGGAMDEDDVKNSQHVDDKGLTVPKMSDLRTHDSFAPRVVGAPSREIRAAFSDDTVRVYQAYNAHIGDVGVEAQSFQ